jgi:hypothetical protein
MLASYENIQYVSVIKTEKAPTSKTVVINDLRYQDL